MEAGLAHGSELLRVGRYPPAGVEAGVEPWILPDNLTFQAPALREQSPDGHLFVEGAGVVPNVKVPVTVESLLYPQIDELAVADQALQALGATKQTTAASPPLPPPVGTCGANRRWQATAGPPALATQVWSHAPD